MTDEKLYELCRKYGAEALEARRKFIGLLPEVFKRRLYTKKGFCSIFEFAAKLGGLSHDQVRRVLRLEQKLKHAPHLREALVTGAVSHNKLDRAAAIATAENDKELLEKVKILPQKALEVLVQDEKRAGLSQPLLGDNFVRAHEIQLDEDVKKQLAQLQEKGIDINDLLREMLKKREEEIEHEKSEIVSEIKPTNSRYIPVKIQRILKKEHGSVCTIPLCKRPIINHHHSQRFALSKTHDPRYLAPLCREHHTIAHSIDQKYQVVRLL